MARESLRVLEAKDRGDVMTTKEMPLTPIKNLKPQLLCIGKLLGMDLYIDVCGKNEKLYYTAQKLLNKLIEGNRNS